MFSLVPVLLLVGGSWAFVPIGETHGDFKPSTWVAPKPAPVQAQGRAYGGGRPKHGYGSNKASHHKVELGIDPGKIVLKCKVQEPLEHIVWIRNKCPNDQYDGGHLVAEGATVTDKALYDVRILGGNSSITSELQLKKPLDPATAGFFRCEAWPHGGGGPPYGQNVAQDVYVIGGQEMLRRCFGGWDDTQHQPHYDSWAKHRSNEPSVAAVAASSPMQQQQPQQNHPQQQQHSNTPKYHPHQQHYYPRYNYSDLRHSSSHESPEVVAPSRPRKEHIMPVETSTAPASSGGLLTRTGAYHPQPLQHQPLQHQISTETPVAVLTQQSLPPRSYIAATPQPLIAPFIPSLPFPQHMLHRQPQKVEATTEAPRVAAPAESNHNSSASSWDIEELMKEYPQQLKNRRGKAVEEKVFVVTPTPLTPADK